MDEFGDDKRRRANHKARFLGKSWYLFFLRYDSIYAGKDIELPNFEWVIIRTSTWSSRNFEPLTRTGQKVTCSVNNPSYNFPNLPFLRFWVLSFEKWFSIFGTVKNSWLNRNRFRVTVTNGYDMLRDILTRRECFW